MQSASMADVIHQQMEDNVYNFTKDGKCSGCGNCCSRLLVLDRKEIKEIRRYMKKHDIKEQKHLLPISNPDSIDLTCPFLNMSGGSKKCVIYPVRPMICRKFICDSEQRAKLTREEVGKTRRVVDMKEVFFGESEVV